MNPDARETYSAALGVIKLAANDARLQHEKWRACDGWIYNLGTVLVIVLTTAAAILPVASSAPGEVAAGVPSWVPKALAGAATAWVAVDRALAFGMRWRFHTELAGGYQMIVNRIAVFEVIPSDKRDAAFDSIMSAFAALQAREASVPGSGASVQEGAAK